MHKQEVPDGNSVRLPDEYPLCTLSQARAGQRLERAWFLKIAFVRDVGMHVCVRPRGYKLHSRDTEPVQPAE